MWFFFSFVFVSFFLFVGLFFVFPHRMFGLLFLWAKKKMGSRY